MERFDPFTYISDLIAVHRRLNVKIRSDQNIGQLVEQRGITRESIYRLCLEHDRKSVILYINSLSDRNGQSAEELREN